MADRVSRSVRRRANWRVLLQVQRNGDMGSPRVSGSITASRAGISRGSCSTNLFARLLSAALGPGAVAT